MTISTKWPLILLSGVQCIITLWHIWDSQKSVPSVVWQLYQVQVEGGQVLLQWWCTVELHIVRLDHTKMSITLTSGFIECSFTIWDWPGWDYSKTWGILERVTKRAWGIVQLYRKKIIYKNLLRLTFASYNHKLDRTYIIWIHWLSSAGFGWWDSMFGWLQC